MEYKKQELDFVERTKIIIQQYNNLNSDEPKYEVTLLFNCFVGLIILPQQHWFKKLPKSEIEDEKWGISASRISFIKTGEIKNVKNIARHIRNSLSHYKFEVLSNKNEEMDRIQFKDYDKSRKKITFEATIPLDEIRQFAESLSDFFVSEMKKSQRPGN